MSQPQEPFARIEAAVPLRPEFRFTRPVDWSIAQGESWAVVGPNGAGKSLLTGLLTRRVPLRNGIINIYHPEGTAAIRSLSFHDIHPPSELRNMYYQQRWNATETDASPRVEEVFPQLCQGESFGREGFEIGHLAGRRAISLSSGELRKLLIARALCGDPRMLILDNPFIGLDAPSRAVLDRMLRSLCEKGLLQCILVVSDPADIPEWIDRVLPLCAMEVLPPMSREDFQHDSRLKARLFGEDAPEEFDFPAAIHPPASFSIAVQVNRVNVSYQGLPILRDVDWTVRRGEKWALVGANGSGKSTLLSLICGDNPQAYANDIVLFDRRRGTGESIWDIKKRIGYVSPEMHTYYLEPIPCEEVVASGFFDSVGLYRRCTPEQTAAAREWLRLFAAEGLAGKPFTQISYGQQRLVLLARAFVKDPDLLVLDEPFHGLDAGKKRLCGAIVEALARQRDKTLLFVSHYRDEIPPCAEHEKILPAPTTR